MRKIPLAVASAAILAFGACENMTTSEQMVVGGVAGAAAGAITAKALDLDDDWVIIGALGGAAAGSLVARNTQNNRCAYARGDGTYYTRPCP